MIRPFLLAPFALLAAACGTQGTYELHWSIACVTGQPDPCPVSTAQDCSLTGFDAVAVVAVRGTQSTRSLFPCFSPLGPMGLGPGLGRGPTTLEVSGLSPGGQLLAGPVAVDVDIPAIGAVSTAVMLPRPAACRDGVDNDGDGLVDMMDPDCHSPDDIHE